MDVTLILTVVFGLVSVAAIVIAYRFAERKKPAFAYETSRIIGLGTEAPPQLKITFAGREVPDVWRTRFIFFNKGNKSIRREEVAEPIKVHFKNAWILDIPRLTQSKPEIDLTATQSNYDGGASVELQFKFLDHNDGAVVEVLHTECAGVSCAGYIMEAGKPRHVGKFEPRRPAPRRMIAMLTISGAWSLLSLAGVGWLAYSVISGEASLGNPTANLLVGALISYGGWFAAQVVVRTLRFFKFPSWSMTRF